MDIAEEFKEKGFNTFLYFLLINEIEVCKSRVEERVTVDHGHPVSEQTIEKRFHQGLYFLNRCISQFDKVFLYDASSTYDMKAIAVIEKGKLTRKIREIPAALREKLPDINEIIKD